MNIKNLNEAIVLIAEKKNEIRNYRESDLAFEVLEEEIRVLQNELQTKFGSYIEEALFNIYDEYCPDNEIQPLPSYITLEYLLDLEREGVAVDVDDFPGITATLALVPDPVRFILKGKKEAVKEVVWSPRQLSET